MAKMKLNTNAFLAGGLAGAGQGHASRILGPTFGPAALYGAVGAYMKNDTLQTLSGLALGRQALSGAPGQGTVEVL